MKKIVVKVGSLAVSNIDTGIDTQKIKILGIDLNSLRELGHQVVLVSSGAINSGKIYLDKKSDPKSIEFSQAAASIGQPILMKEYQNFFEKCQTRVSQVLVTHEDFKNRKRFLNIRNTLRLLLSQNILPVINENDSVSYEEITVGDNDQLAAMIAEAIEADLLILLSEADGLYDRDPKDPAAIHFKSVEFDENLAHVKFATKTSVGRGGMSTKIAAVKRLTPLGLDVILGSFNKKNPILRLLNHEGGTRFFGKKIEKKNSRKSWIASVIKPETYIFIDEGAYTALRKNASLLPIGIKKIAGSFKRGDVVAIKFNNQIIASGICEYDNKELELIRGKKSDEVKLIIKDAPSLVAIHKDNLFLFKE
jgi:glutamate 5-kinase